MTTAKVELWGRQIGAVTWIDERSIAAFQYTPEFCQSGIQVSPVHMPLREAPYEFPALPRTSFYGLPGLLTDSLPDKFGNALIDAWLAREQRDPGDFNPVERLCYTGIRGMGALEYQPTYSASSPPAREVDVERLVELSNQILAERSTLSGHLDGDDDAEDIGDILRVGTSAGGARAKAVLAWNKDTGEFRSGQVEAGNGFTHWLMKFDGIGDNRDKELADPQGYGRIEYAYYLMATAARITMMPSRLHEEGGRAHFMTKRFDRGDDGRKLHYQSLAALMHFDFNMAGAHSYEQAVLAAKQLGLSTEDIRQQVRRAFFNVVARNQDDHVKNIGFVMNQSGQWRLSPAFDVAYSYNPEGAWTSRHQMSLNGKRENFEREDLVQLARVAGLKRRAALDMLDEVINAAAAWTSFARYAGVSPEHTDNINQHLRLLTR